MRHTNNHVDLVEFPMESTDQLQATKKFFNEAFDWKFNDFGDAYAATEESGAEVGLIHDAASSGSMPLTVLYVTDLEATYEKIVTAGGTIIKEIYPFPGGRRFHFKEPSGNELAAWSE